MGVDSTDTTSSRVWLSNNCPISHYHPPTMIVLPTETTANTNVTPQGLLWSNNGLGIYLVLFCTGASLLHVTNIRVDTYLALGTACRVSRARNTRSLRNYSYWHEWQSAETNLSIDAKYTQWWRRGQGGASIFKKSGFPYLLPSFYSWEPHFIPISHSSIFLSVRP